MHRLKDFMQYAPYPLMIILIAMLLANLTHTEKTIESMKIELDQLSRESQTQQITNAGLRESLDEILNRLHDLDQKIDSAVDSIPEYIPYDVPISDELQDHLYDLCQREDVEIELALGVIWKESRFNENISDNINSNGTRDRGVMQINSCNWSRMAREGLDVNNPKDNMEYGVKMLSRLKTKGYTTEQVLMAYNAGEYGMTKGWGRGYASDVLQVYEANCVG